MGETCLSPDEVADVLKRMQQDWLGGSYHILKRNCHDFSVEFCLRLGARAPPTWINSLAETGADAADYLDSESDYDGGKAFVDFLSGIGSTVLPLFWNSDADEGAQSRLEVEPKPEEESDSDWSPDRLENQWAFPQAENEVDDLESESRGGQGDFAASSPASQLSLSWPAPRTIDTAHNEEHDQGLIQDDSAHNPDSPLVPSKLSTTPESTASPTRRIVTPLRQRKGELPNPFLAIAVIA